MIYDKRKNIFYNIKDFSSNNQQSKILPRSKKAILFWKSNKYIIAILFSIFSLTFIQAQQKSETQYLLKGNGPIKMNAFGGPTLTFSTVYKKFAVFLGADAGIILNKSLLIAGYAEGLITEYPLSIDNMIDENEEFIEDIDLRLRFNHAGFCLGYIYKSEKPIHIGVSSRLGWGSIKWKSVGENNPPEELKDNVFVITPKIDIGFNLLPWAKMVVGGGYRFVTGISGTYQYKGTGYPLNKIYEKEIFQVKAFDSYIVYVGFYFGNFK